MSIKGKISKVSLAVVSGAALGAAALANSDHASADEVYTVKSGDTLSELSYKFGLNGDYMSIAKKNKIANPDLILVGQKLVISDDGTVQKSTKVQTKQLPESNKMTSSISVAPSSAAPVSSAAVSVSSSSASSSSVSSSSSAVSSSAASSSSAAVVSSSKASSKAPTVKHTVAPKKPAAPKKTVTPKNNTNTNTNNNNHHSSNNNHYNGSTSVAAVAAEMQARTGVSATTWQRIIMRESGGNPYISNPTSGAYGLFQLLGHGEYRGMSVAEQIDMAVRVYNAQGLSAWGE